MYPSSSQPNCSFYVMAIWFVPCLICHKKSASSRFYCSKKTFEKEMYLFCYFSFHFEIRYVETAMLISAKWVSNFPNFSNVPRVSAISVCKSNKGNFAAVITNRKHRTRSNSTIQKWTFCKIKFSKLLFCTANTKVTFKCFEKKNLKIMQLEKTPAQKYLRLCIHLYIVCCALVIFKDI